MRIVRGILAYSLLLVVGIPTLLFAQGSFTGNHSLSYDREGTWLCWMPNDKMSKSCILITEFVPVSKLDDVAPSARGYVRCRDGRIEIGNIDFETTPGRPLFDFDQICG